MRKQAKSWMMKIILGLIIVVFIFYFGSLKGTKGAEAVAKVEGKVITNADYHRAFQDLYETYKRYLGENLTDDAVKKMNLGQQALDALINEAIVLNEAKKLKITASEDEVRALILANPGFQREGVFEQQLYERTLHANKLTPEDFETGQKKRITAFRLETLIKEGAKTFDRELFDIYALQNDKVNVDFIRLSPKQFVNRVKPSEADLEKFLRENGERFRIPDKLQVKYIFFSGEAQSGTIKITDDEINDYYSLHKDRLVKSGGKDLTPAIKEKIISEIKSEKALDKASEAVKKARDMIYQYDNFDEYARKNGLQVHTTDFFAKNHPPVEFSEIKDIHKYLADLRKEDLSPILTTSKGFYLMKVSNLKASYIPSLADVREEVNHQVIEKESRTLASKEAGRILETLKKGEDFGKAAKEADVKITETGFFVPGSDIPKIGPSKDLAQTLIQLSEKRPYPDSVFDVNGDFIVVKFKQRTLVDMKDFDANRDKLQMAYLQMKEGVYFQSWLNEMKEKLKKTGELKIYKEPGELTGR